MLGKKRVSKREYPRKTSSGGGLLNKGLKEMRKPEFQAKGTASAKA